MLAGLGGYAFARLRFPGREVLFWLVLATLMVPDQLRLIPVFVMLTNWHLIASFSGVHPHQPRHRDATSSSCASTS